MNSMGAPLFPLRDDEANFAAAAAVLMLLQECGTKVRVLVVWGAAWVVAARTGVLAQALQRITRKEPLAR